MEYIKLIFEKTKLYFKNYSVQFKFDLSNNLQYCIVSGKGYNDIKINFDKFFIDSTFIYVPKNDFIQFADSLDSLFMTTTENKLLSNTDDLNEDGVCLITERNQTYYCYNCCTVRTNSCGNKKCKIK